jgi:hypothetical protein
MYGMPNSNEAGGTMNAIIQLHSALAIYQLAMAYPAACNPA